MDHRDAFLEALAENEDDVTTRLIYADWLDEQGQHEEAERQRQWPAAKAWLVHFCEVNNQSEYEWHIPYEELLALGAKAIARSTDGWCYFNCGNNETMCSALRRERDDFWKNWSIVTGTPLPPDISPNSGFSCAC